MAQPTIEVLGVYSLPVTNELVGEQTEILYGSGLAGAERREAEGQCRDQLASTVLVEVLVRNGDKCFNVGDFSLLHGDVPRDNWQVA